MCKSLIILLITAQILLTSKDSSASEKLIIATCQPYLNQLVTIIGENEVIKNATVGPNVSLGNATHVSNSTIKNSLVQTHAHIKNANLNNAMIGNHAAFDGNFSEISIGDYSVLE